MLINVDRYSGGVYLREYICSILGNKILYCRYISIYHISHYYIGDLQLAQKNVSKFVILGLLTCRPMSGYDIKKAIEISISEFWHESFGNIYTTLRKLLNSGFVEKTVKEQSGKPDRYVYSITDSGMHTLTEWIIEPCDIPRIRDEFLVKFFFRHHLPLKDDLQILEDYRKALLVKLEAVRRIEERIETEMQNNFDREHVITYLTFSQGRNVLEAKLTWCGMAKKTIMKIKD